jgi:hypothetical protein
VPSRVQPFKEALVQGDDVAVQPLHSQRRKRLLPQLLQVVEGQQRHQEGGGAALQRQLRVVPNLQRARAGMRASLSVWHPA